MRLISILSHLLITMITIGISCHSYATIRIHDDLQEHQFEHIPEKIISLDWDITEQLLELETLPIGAPSIAAYNIWVAQPLIPETVEDIGTRSEPNLEKIASMAPDVIIAASAQKDLLPALSKIAPVVLLENYRKDQNAGETAIEHFKILAKLLGKEELAQRKLTNLYARLDVLGQQILQAYHGTPPKVVPGRFGSDTSLFLYTENSTSDWVLAHLGLENAYPLPNATWSVSQKRFESLKHLEDYFLYILPFYEEEKLSQSFLWQAMPFVRAKHVNKVDAVWSYGGAMSLLYMAEAYTKSLLEIAP